MDFVRQIVAVKPFLQLAGDLLCKMSTKRPMCETLKLGLGAFKNYVENKGWVRELQKEHIWLRERVARADLL